MSRAKEKNRKLKRRQQKEYTKTLNQYSDNLEPISIDDFIKKTGKEPPRYFIKAYVSKKYLVQLYQETDKPLRISINRTTVNLNMEWDAELSWEEIQSIKNEIGFEDYDCVEIYPVQKDVVNVVNMRHIWVMDEPLSFPWRN